MKRLITIVLVLFALHAMAQSECETVYSRETGQPNLFVYSLKPKGFVIVSALNEVLAYSYESSFPSLDSLPAQIAYWIELYNTQTDYLIKHPGQARHELKSQQSVEPLLSSQWAQDCYYNEACPIDTSGPCQHVMAGCVAVTMAQIMYYHKCPMVGNGSTSYNCPSYGTLSADFGQTFYQWDDMEDHLDGSNTSVAQLISHCGISVKMHYGPNASGAQNDDALSAFRQFFRFPVAAMAKRLECTDEEWIALIKENLDEGLPVYYAGTSDKGGHAFVCDGYDSNGLFHFNFGWNGGADGYYSLSDPGGYSNGQNVIYDLFPSDHTYLNCDSHGIIYVTSDGTGDGSSWENATKELQLAMYESQTEDRSIWVKEGTYSRPNDDYMYCISQQCRLYGGFIGNEPYDYDLSLRDYDAHPSILDGHLNWGIIKVSTDSNANLILIDGFTIQNGNASQGSGVWTNNDIQIKNCLFRFNHSKSYGGAFSSINPAFIVINSLMENCKFYSNDAKNGGAIWEYGNTTYHQCQFHENLAQNEGGAVCCSPYSTHIFVNCVFSNNTAKYGGGIYNNGGNTQLWSCLINNNTAENGGGCYSGSGGLRLFNCTVVKNKAQNNCGGVGVYYSNVIKNCIIWGNESQGNITQIGPLIDYTYCAVQNDQSGSELNFNASSENDGVSDEFYIRFIDPDITAGSLGQGGDWRLQPNSCCIDMGVIIADQPETDLDGNPRIWNGAIDLGAYEWSTMNCEELTSGKPILIPNPANDIIEISMPFIDEVEVFNLNGERVFHNNANRQVVTLDVTSFPDGIYIVKVKQLNNFFFERLVVNHKL